MGEKDKKEQIDKNAVELQELKRSHEAMKKKLEGNNARIKGLREDLSTSRNALIDYSNKSKNDNELINALKEETKRLQAQVESETGVIIREHGTNGPDDQVVEKLRMLCHKHEATVARQSRIVESLKQELEASQGREEAAKARERQVANHPTSD